MLPPSTEPSPSARGRKALLDWYGPRRTTYPWRRGRADPYAVLVSEVMLQQTQVSRVVPAFESFMRRFPTAEVLAAASGGDVIRMWGRLGYQRRAVALHAAARAIVRDHGGRVPRDPAALRSLPGVGDYTASAVASIAFGRPVAAIDTNVRRIWARVAHGAEADEVPAARSRADATAWLDVRHPSAWNQALMDLGREVCRPKPRCAACPLRPWCRFAAEGRVGRPSARPQAVFEGSLRQVRGSVVSLLRERAWTTVGRASSSTGFPADRVTQAVSGLARDGVIEASPAALRGAPGGRISLPRS